MTQRQFTIDPATACIPAVDWMTRLRAAPSCAVRIRTMRDDDMLCFGMVEGPPLPSGLPGIAGAMIIKHAEHWRFVANWAIGFNRATRRASHTVTGKFVFVNDDQIRLLGALSVAAEPVFARICRRLQWVEQHTAPVDLRRFHNHSIRPYWRGEMISAGINAFGVPGPDHVLAPVLWAHQPAPRPKCVNLPLLFESVTYWTVGSYAVRVQAGLLPTWSDAFRYVTTQIKLRRDGDRLVLVNSRTGAEHDEAIGDSVALFRLPDGLEASAATMADFKHIDLPIAQWPIAESAEFVLRGCAVNPIKELHLAIPA
ncbi:hypothetical protein [Burkholderia territorii]|nr:hypothetical protein [Burkholderia territorii]